MKLKIGKTYVARNGDIFGPLIDGGYGLFDAENSELHWCENGEVGSGCSSDIGLDLIRAYNHHKRPSTHDIAYLAAIAGGADCERAKEIAYSICALSQPHN